MRVGILATGESELSGLPRALAARFPEHEFEAVTQRPEPGGRHRPFDGFTSGRVSLPVPQRRSNLSKLVAAMARTIEPGRDNDPPDLLLVVDDLELVNMDNAEIVVAAFRSATQRHLEQLEATQDASFVRRLRAALCERVSFHLVSPMIEAWLFADPRGPAHAGAPAERLPPKLLAGVDPEQFETEDSNYQADDGSACRAWRNKSGKPAWIREQRELHPKAYLAWLCRDPEFKRCSRYRETGPEGEACGAEALARIDWSALLGRSVHCRYARALVEDLADALGEPALPGEAGESASLTSRFDLPRDPVLRNL